MMKITAEVDEKAYGLLCQPNEVQPLMKALSELYSVIWTEACYDALNESTKTLCKKLLPFIEQANEILEFKK